MNKETKALFLSSIILLLLLKPPTSFSSTEIITSTIEHNASIYEEIYIFSDNDFSNYSCSGNGSIVNLVCLSNRYVLKCPSSLSPITCLCDYSYEM